MTELFIVPSGQLQKAANVMRDDSADELSKIKAVDLITKWRNLYTEPLSRFQQSIKYALKYTKYKDCLIVQRLKRMPSIIDKLKRFSDMQLTRMQDIGGVRIIVDNISDVYEIFDLIKAAKMLFKPLDKYHDYIKIPKADGYRSLHQVFKYISGVPEIPQLRFELQIRTKLQHVWATAVETLGIIENESFKTGKGDDAYKNFFKVISLLFSIEEHTAAPEVLRKVNLKSLKITLALVERDLNVINKLSGIAATIESTSTIQSEDEQPDYFILELIRDSKNIDNSKLLVTPYKKEFAEQAESYYHSRERETASDPNRQIVMIRADGINTIKEAYPNFLLDVPEFVSRVKSYISGVDLSALGGKPRQQGEQHGIPISELLNF